MPFQKTRLFWMSLIALVAVIAVGARSLLERPYTFKGSAINPSAPAAEIGLPATSGQAFRLADQRGKVVLLFFGYTTCPDVCPTTLAEMKRVRHELGSAGSQVQVVFVSVDPERDTLDKLKTYVSAFDPSFIGVTGSEAELTPVWKAYGVYRQKTNTGSAAGYLVDHSSFTYVVDRNGNLRETFVYGSPVGDIIKDVRHLLREKMQ